MNADDRRHARAQRDDAMPAHDEPLTYQELLDEALSLTFPASDPPAVGAAMHAAQRLSTGKDATDWLLASGADSRPRCGR